MVSVLRLRRFWGLVAIWTHAVRKHSQPCDLALIKASRCCTTSSARAQNSAATSNPKTSMPPHRI
eukprot:2407049-Amphidinium_carterae.1